MKMMTVFLREMYDKTHWFTDKEAWGVYRFAAYVEAGFWAFFILTMIYGALELPQKESVVMYGRSIWGTAYGVYVIFVLISVRSMEWRFEKTAAAVLAGIPPFGSLLFVRAVKKQRQKNPPRVTPPAHLKDDA